MKAQLKNLDNQLRKALRTLEERLRILDVSALPLDPFYRDRYLQEKLDILESATIRARSQLRMALCDSVDLSRAVLVDHGGGTGATGMLAKLAGVGTVIYNDIAPKMLDTARQVGLAVGAACDHYVLGDFDVLLSYLRERDISCDALISYDVIEHIYDMEHFIAGLSGLSRGGAFVVVMSSGANKYSPRYLRSVFPIQKRAEKEWFALRKQMIQELAPGLSGSEVVRLAEATRYCTRPAIERAVRRYQETGVIECDGLSLVNRTDPYGTNTCHPETGWWAEHLMNPWYLKGCLQAAGFEACVKNGLYGRPTGRAKRVGAKIINVVVKLMGPPGIALAAYYTLWAHRTVPPATR